MAFLVAPRLVLLPACLIYLAGHGQLTAGLANTYRELQQFEIPGSELGFGEGPLPRILPLLRMYKLQLRELTASALAVESDPRRLHAAMEAALQTEGIPVAAIDDSVQRRPYGQIHKVEVHRPPDQPSLLTVTYHLQLSHAIDSSLTIYRDRQPIFEADHNDYAKWELDAFEIPHPQFTATDANGAFVMLLTASSGVYGSSISNSTASIAKDSPIRSTAPSLPKNSTKSPSIPTAFAWNR